MKKIKGYRGIGSEKGKFVPAEDAFFYAANECGITIFDQTAPLADEFKKMLVEWYFSGNWIEVGRNADGERSANTSIFTA